MHTLQPKHVKLKADEIKVLLEKYNISLAQLPKIKSTDPALIPQVFAAGVRNREQSFNFFVKFLVK